VGKKGVIKRFTSIAYVREVEKFNLNSFLSLTNMVMRVCS